MEILRLIILIGAILYSSFFISYIFKNKFGETIVSSFVVLTLLMMLSAFLGRLSYYKYVFAIFFIIITVFFAIRIIKNKDKVLKYFSSFLSPSVIIYILFFIYMYINLQNVGLSNIDDLGLWGTRIKDMMRTDVMYTNEQYTAFGISSYPPFTGMLGVLFCKILGGFNESYVILSMSMFSISFFFPLLDKFKWDIKGIFASISTFILSVLITLCVSQNSSMAYESFVYNSLYVDWLLSFALASSFYKIYNFDFNSVFDYLFIGVNCTVMILTKQIGIALVLLVVATLLLKLLFEKNKNKQSFIKYFTLSALLPIIVFVIWRWYLSLFIGKTSIDGGMISNASNTLSNDIDTALNTIKLFVEAFFNRDIMVHPIELSYFWLIIIIVFVLSIFGIIKKKDKTYYLTTLMYFLGSLGYALAILLSYLFIFGYEGTTLAMYGRYMQTYTYAGVIIVLMLMANNIKFDKFNITLVIATLLMVEPNSIDTIIYNPNRVKFRESEIAKLDNYFETEYNYQNLLVINQTNMAYKNLIRFTADEKGENISFYQLTKDTPIEEFINLLKENELLYIGDYDDIFMPFWEELTDLPPYNNSLYRIINNNHDIEFELIYTWDD